MVYIYTTEYYSAIKKNETLTFATTWMNLEMIILSEVKSGKERQILYHLHVESKKKSQRIFKTETDS